MHIVGNVYYILEFKNIFLSQPKNKEEILRNHPLTLFNCYSNQESLLHYTHCIIENSERCHLGEAQADEVEL